jgi:CBS-domain-containing membrane protein
MRSPSKPFLALTAQDLMTREVVTVPERMSLAVAARLLSRAHISGAPVVDVAGVCVGVISATDFLALADRTCPVVHGPCTAPMCVCSEWQVMDPGELPPDEVREHMTADPVTVRPEAPVGDVARAMLDAHIHRVIVVDQWGRPVGIVSSTDLIAAVAQDEAARLIPSPAVR